MTVTMQHPAFAAAERLAPVPDREAIAGAWVRHFAALGFAAHTAFQDALRSPGPELGFLVTIGVSATAAAFALESHTYTVQELWDLTPEAGALNGEWEEWLTETLDEKGVNPADINPRYNAVDFRSPRAEVADR